MPYSNATIEDSTTAHRVSICELLDRVLNKGVVLTGEIVISVANIELLYVALSLLVSSVETLLEAMDRPAEGRKVALEIAQSERRMRDVVERQKREK